MGRTAILLWSLAALAALAAGGCPEKDPFVEPAEVVSVEVIPGDSAIQVGPGAPVAVDFVARVTRFDGEVEETTAVSWESSNITVGTIDDEGHFVSGDATGGVTTIRATYLGVWGQTELTVVFTQEVTAGGAPAGAGALFDPPAEAGTGDEPVVLYPLDRVKIPRNTPRVTFMWDAGPVATLFRLRFRSEVTQVDVITDQLSWIPDEALWHTIAAANAGGTTTLELAGVAWHDEAGTPVADSPPYTAAGETTMDISRLDADGSIYYWNASIGGVYRIPFGSSEPTEFYGMNNYGHCVSCHVISPDGTRMTVTYDGGNGPLGVVSMAAPLDDGQAVIPYAGGRVGNFKTFSPDGDLLLSSYDGVLSVSDAHSGAHLYDLDLPFPATMPSWSPRGDRIAIVMPDEDAYSLDWVFNGSRIALLYVDGDGTIGTEPDVIVDPEEEVSVYYPTFSPDGDWIAYNQSWDTTGAADSWDSYDDPAATLMVVSADGTVGYELYDANGEGLLTNSWPGWGPLPDADVLWLTFSSKRPYGFLTTAADNRPQIWVTAFDLEAAAAGGQGDPSSPPFWLPFQDIATNNHIPAWGPE